MTELSEFCVFHFDGKGLAERHSIDTKDLASNTKFTWVHLNGNILNRESWPAHLKVDPVVVEALLAEETRPRCTPHGEGVILNLRGVNLNPGAEPEDMVSIRFWIEETRIVSVWRRPLLAVQDLFDTIERNQAPKSPGALVAKLVLRLADRVEPIVADLNEGIDSLEELILDSKASISNQQLANIRRKSIVLRRYLIPQKDALTTLEIEDVKWLDDRDRNHIREAAERITRLGEDLDAIRDRAQIVHDQILSQRAERMNNQMFVLSIVAAIFLPLGFITGLLGVNVGGIPGTNSPYAFFIVCISLIMLTGAQIWVFRKLGMWSGNG